MEEKNDVEPQLAAIRRRLLTRLQKLQEMADFFDGPSALPPSLHRERQEHIAEALRELLRLGKTTVSSKGKLFEWARTTITQWLQLLPKSKEILPQLLPLLQSAVDDEILRDTREAGRSRPSRKKRRFATSKKPREVKSPKGINYRSKLKRAICNALIVNSELSDPEVAVALDEAGFDLKDAPPAFRQGGFRGLEDMYRRDETLRQNFSSRVTEVRRDLQIPPRR